MWQELADGLLFRLALHPQLEEEIESVTARVLLAVGDDELPAFVRCGQILEDRLPSASRTVIADAGHLALLERPVSAAAAIERHVGMAAAMR
jgi:pimeloyl-ACP methyl ester carboxylesterase